MSVELISITRGAGKLEGKTAQEIISYTARVSNPSNQYNFESAPRLLNYLAKNKHWSPFEMSSMGVEIRTSRLVSQQILRHRSFVFQEYSLRYSSVEESNFISFEARRQDLKNRQNSIDDLPEDIKQEWSDRQKNNWEKSLEDYEWALSNGIAKESARAILPLSTKTTILMNGSVRSWIHYIDTRTDKATQLEHRMIAEQCKNIFIDQFPDVSGALGWAKELKHGM